MGKITMKTRFFEPHGERVGGHIRRVARLVCSQCGVTDSINCASGSGTTLPPDVISKKFGAKGWMVGPNSNSDLCPQHANRRKSAAMETVAAMPAKKAEEPREMTREHRRIILVKLEEVYIDEKSGYDSGWSDNRVAIDLGIPRAWVTKLRDENFGPSGINEEMGDFLQQADAMLTKAKEYREEAKATETYIQGTWVQVEKSMAKMNEIVHRLDQIESLAGKIRKLAAL